MHPRICVSVAARFCFCSRARSRNIRCERWDDIFDRFRPPPTPSLHPPITIAIAMPNIIYMFCNRKMCILFYINFVGDCVNFFQGRSVSIFKERKRKSLKMFKTKTHTNLRKKLLFSPLTFWPRLSVSGYVQMLVKHVCLLVHQMWTVFVMSNDYSIIRKDAPGSLVKLVKGPIRN